MKNIAIFASGSGTNAEQIIKHFTNSNVAQVKVVICNVAHAGVFKRAEKLNIPSLLIKNEDVASPQNLILQLNEMGIDLVVLAGFLRKIPNEFVKAFENKIVNIHPSLLPKYGGKGMYGSKVHEAVINAGESESGITIHLVNEKYDDGKVLFQAKCNVSANDSADLLAQKIHQLEHTHFPMVLEEFLR